MKVKLLEDVSTPEMWIPESKKPTFKKGRIVKVIPADNMPDGHDIKYWIDHPSLEYHPYGIGLEESQYVIVED